MADGHLTRLTNHPANDFRPTWSPDSSKIAFTSKREGTYDLYVVDVEGTNPRRLTAFETHETYPQWSPDGKTILFQMMGPDEEGLGLFTLTIDTGQHAPLTTGSESFAAWSPDGAQICFLDDTEDGFGIIVMNADGTARQRVVPLL